MLSIKGTTLNGPTSKKDKYNDNLLFSCCCARVDFSWIFSQVCDCYTNHWRCDDICLSEALIEDSLFYNVGVVRGGSWPRVLCMTNYMRRTSSITSLPCTQRRQSGSSDTP